MNPALWKTYKSKVLKTFNADQEEDSVEQNNEEETTATLTQTQTQTQTQTEEGPSSVAQLAKKMQGAGVKGWKSMASVFNKDDEHQLLASESNTPAADHPLAVKPEEPRQEKRAMQENEAAAEEGRQAQEGGREEETSYTTLGGPEETTFKWSFMTSKLAELKSKSIAKTN
ncbi:Testis development-related protein [Acipenser ruthenus]|uniref:Testis development-related protein n=1 Tax=Acipenser ruthenus TaxID=7906 RepID=A0A444UVH8_ACIRT|nr:Testis development-related protein [Acipenser ruthenus]